MVNKMKISLVYKETKSPCGRFLQKIDLIEVSKSEEDSSKYSKLYGLQLPKEEKNYSCFRTLTIPVQ